MFALLCAFLISILLQDSLLMENNLSIPISFACGLYGRKEALWSGEIRPQGIDLNFIVQSHPRGVFDRMAGGYESDCSEMSLSEYVCRTQQENEASSLSPSSRLEPSGTAS
jgi:hypothetical protein